MVEAQTHKWVSKTLHLDVKDGGGADCVTRNYRGMDSSGKDILYYTDMCPVNVAHSPGG